MGLMLVGIVQGQGGFAENVRVIQRRGVGGGAIETTFVVVVVARRTIPGDSGRVAETGRGMMGIGVGVVAVPLLLLLLLMEDVSVHYRRLSRILLVLLWHFEVRLHGQWQRLAVHLLLMVVVVVTVTRPWVVLRLGMLKL